MTEINYLAVLVATVAVFAVSTVYYMAFGSQMARLNDAYAGPDAARPPVWKIAVELVRSFVLATVVAGLTSRMDVTDWTGALILGLVLWIGFPLVLWSGSVMWEKVPSKLAAIHAGDWLLKLLVIAFIVGLWR